MNPHKKCRIISQSLLTALCLFLFCSCDGYSSKMDIGNEHTPETIHPQKVINIQPLGDVDPEYLQVIKVAISEFYGFESKVLSPVKVTSDLLTGSKTRLDASKILKKFKTSEYRLIITERDIAHRNVERNVNEWGIFGLGIVGGRTCVVSAFRLKRSKGKPVTRELFIERLQKVALHELGHNLGLHHCINDSLCLMNDARGTINTIDKVHLKLCAGCGMVTLIDAERAYADRFNPFF